ncbi:ParA family protein (plasmid) [Streptomyces sp. NBC_00536]|uniref:ParA family protein n=1 Tax=Streptomyces sp. NBC_00536 TaxID=2975769 RepID=UPI002E80B8D7|nr:ParA family protein [Streptomyces sp. NBC_00536]WUC84430.1 ParA family protein [Streptomyces sp. NBC_00536]
MSTKTLPRRNLRPNGRTWPLIIAALIISGGSAKTTTISILATILALRGYKVRVFDFDQQRNLSHIFCGKHLDDAEFPTIWDLMLDTATLEEVSVPARFRVGDGWDDDAFSEIPNLTLVRGSRHVKNFDTVAAAEPERMLMAWFERVCNTYKGDDDLWLLDLPASLSKLSVSTLLPMTEDDEVLPPVLVTNKEEEDLGYTFEELAEMVEHMTTRSRRPAPTIKNIVMCSTPTSQRKGVEYHETVEAIERQYGDHFTLHKIRYTDVIPRQHRLQATVPAFASSSAPMEDYSKLATALGFNDLEPA